MPIWRILNTPSIQPHPGLQVQMASRVHWLIDQAQPVHAVQQQVKLAIPWRWIGVSCQWPQLMGLAMLLDMRLYLIGQQVHRFESTVQHKLLLLL